MTGRSAAADHHWPATGSRRRSMLWTGGDEGGRSAQPQHLGRGRRGRSRHAPRDSAAADHPLADDGPPVHAVNRRQPGRALSDEPTPREPTRPAAAAPRPRAQGVLPTLRHAIAPPPTIPWPACGFACRSASGPTALAGPWRSATTGSAAVGLNTGRRSHQRGADSTEAVAHQRRRRKATPLPNGRSDTPGVVRHEWTVASEKPNAPSFLVLRET